jgi:transcriptional regulator with XRE-family HTH domain
VAQDPAEVVRNVARRVVELRLARGMTQEKLAEALACSVQYVSRIEVGENLGLVTLTKIANALGVTVGQLVSGEAAAEDPASAEGVGRRRGRPRKD